MDYSLPALKLLAAQLRVARPIAGDGGSQIVAAMAIGNLRFQRAWLQGVVVEELEGGHVALDDGSSVIELILPNENCPSLMLGAYVLVIGQYVVDNGVPLIKVHKIVDISSSPDREAMWILEVIEAHKLFYASRMC